MWSRRDPVSLFGAWGPCKTGWEDLSQTYRWVSSRFCEGEVGYPLEVVEVGTELAYTVGYEQGQMRIDRGPARLVRIRVTHIYRREEGSWKLVHRHGDFAPTDESPPSATAGRPARTGDIARPSGCAADVYTDRPKRR